MEKNGKNVHYTFGLVRLTTDLICKVMISKVEFSSFSSECQCNLQSFKSGNRWRVSFIMLYFTFASQSKKNL